MKVYPIRAGSHDVMRRISGSPKAEAKATVGSSELRWSNSPSPPPALRHSEAGKKSTNQVTRLPTARRRAYPVPCPDGKEVTLSSSMCRAPCRSPSREISSARIAPAQ